MDVMTKAISTHKEREPLALQNMITCVHVYESFGTHPLCVRTSIYFGIPYLMDTCRVLKCIPYVCLSALGFHICWIV